MADIRDEKNGKLSFVRIAGLEYNHLSRRSIGVAMSSRTTIFGRFRLLFCLFACTFAASSQTLTLPYQPVTAEYSYALDRIIMIAGNPNQLHIFDPSTNTDTAVNLPKPPLALSVSPDGLYAAVGHDALISYVNLQTLTLQQTLTVTTTVNGLVLGNGYIYVLSNDTSIEISSGATSTFFTYGGTDGRLHPSGTAVYLTSNGSPGLLQDLNASTGPITSESTGPYWGDYPVCGGVWFSPDGLRVYTGCATAYQANPQDTGFGFLAGSTQPLDTHADGLYWGTLVGASQIRSLSESAALSQVAAIPVESQYGSPTVLDNQVFLYDSTYLEPAGTFQLPDFVANSNNYQAHGQQVFYNQAGTAMYVVMEADGSSGLLLNYAVQVFPLTNPPVCAPAFNTASVTLPASGTPATVGITAPATCIYQATSNSSWIQLVSGAYGSGNGTITYMVRPNAGAERSGSINIGGQSFSITQLAAAPPASLLTQLSVSVQGAGYSNALNKVVFIVSNPKELHIYDPIAGSDQIVALPKPPFFMSVSPDGLSAAVGFDGWVSVVNLSTATISSTLQVFTDAHTILMAGNGYLYAYPTDTWGDLFSVQISNGSINIANAIYNGRYPQLYYDGTVFYTEGSKWNIVPGPAQIIDQNLSGGCAPFWLTADGARMITFCGQAYTTSEVPALDLQYNGTFSNATLIQWANESPMLHSTAVIPAVGYNGTGNTDTYIQIYGDAYLGYAGELSLPVFMVGSTPYAGHGRYVFWNSQATELVILEQADPTAQLVANYGATVYSMTTPAAGCTFAVGGTSATFDPNGGLNTVSVTTTVGCIWEVSSNVSWITVNSGDAGFGTNSVDYAVAANSGPTRTGILTIAGQTFTVVQNGVGPVTHLSVTAPLSGLVGVPITVTVQALDANNYTVGSFTDSVHFSSTDGAAILPADSTLSNGMAEFPVTLITPGNQTVTATDTVNPSITGTSGPVSISFFVPVPGSTLSGSLANFSWSAVSGATEYQLSVGTAPGATDIFSATSTGTSQIVGSIPCADKVGGTIYVQLSAEVNGTFQQAMAYTYSCKLGLGDFNGDGYQDVIWQNNATHQVTVHDFDGTGGVTYVGWNWLNSSGEPSGWVLVGAADFDGNGVPDLVWEYMPTGQVTVNYYGGPGGATYLGWNWLNSAGNPGWKVVAVADMNNDGVPDLIWQNNTTNQVTVNYYGGTGGATLTGWSWLNAGGEPAGWHVVAAADFDGNGTPDLVWQYTPTRQVTVNYYGGTGGATYLGWNWLNSAGVPGWTVVGANDFNGDGVADLVWQNDMTAQVTLNYYGGTGGATLIGWNWLAATGYPGWTAVVPR